MLMCFRLTAAEIEQEVSALQRNRGGLLPVPAAVSGDRHGKLFLYHMGIRGSLNHPQRLFFVCCSCGTIFN